MTQKNKVSIIVSVILLFAGAFIALDFSRIFLVPQNLYPDSYVVTRFLKLGVSFLSGFIVWSNINNHFSKSDSIKMKIAFCIIFIGDTAFTFRIIPVGISAFALGQLLLTIRNSKGLYPYLKGGVEHLRYIVTTAIITVVLGAVVLYFVFYRPFGATPMVIGFSFYAIFLCFSVWMAFTTKKIGFFDPLHSTLLIIGMICFFCCDVTVGYGIVSKGILDREIVTSLTWIFYTPALVLLGLSSYKTFK